MHTSKKQINHFDKFSYLNSLFCHMSLVHLLIQRTIYTNADRTFHIYSEVVDLKVLGHATCDMVVLKSNTFALSELTSYNFTRHCALVRFFGLGGTPLSSNSMRCSRRSFNVTRCFLRKSHATCTGYRPLALYSSISKNAVATVFMTSSPNSSLSSASFSSSSLIIRCKNVNLLL